MAAARWEEYSWFSEKITEERREGANERERSARACGRGRGLAERKIKPTQSSSHVTVRITDVPTDTQCGLWAEACGEPVWLHLACFLACLRALEYVGLLCA